MLGLACGFINYRIHAYLQRPGPANRIKENTAVVTHRAILDLCEKAYGGDHDI